MGVPHTHYTQAGAVTELRKSTEGINTKNKKMKRTVGITVILAMSTIVWFSCKKSQNRNPHYSCVCKFKSYGTNVDTTTETEYPASVNSDRRLADSTCRHYQVVLVPHDSAAKCNLY